MKKTNVKHLVEQIQKLASPPPPPPAGYQSSGVSAPPRPPGSNFAGPTPSRTPAYAPPQAIVKMQSELTNLARTVTSEIGASSLAASPGANPGDAQKEAAGRLAFSNFITEHYIRQSDVPAVEYDPNPVKTDMSEKSPSRPTRMNVVMDTMSRVGSPNSEFKIDGKWGPRTNAALRNAYALAFALLKMAHDFKMNPRTYSQADLEKLKELVPLHDTALSFTDKLARAQEISQHLMAIRNLFTEVKNNILQKPAYKSYIEGTQPYTTYQKDQVLSPQTIADLNKKFVNMNVTGTDAEGQSKTVPITISDLVTPQAFQLWQQKNLPDLPSNNILEQINKHLDETDVSKGAM